ncbi:MAG TPA: DUF6229 family protein [Acidimicrobiales bacterium]|jgi:hypothetical protein
MPTLEMTEEIVARWRSEAGDDNPAGPLFSGRYAEVELAEPMAAATLRCETFGQCGTACTGSYPNQCC